ncbi:MAG: S-layer homology domain-containing protein [Oscillospiraceae bacterium]|jgi:spore germination protein YaaH|nr:S-layer homology domain-containing protein [Oscillospiraceae bacterium]
MKRFTTLFAAVLTVTAIFTPRAAAYKSISYLYGGTTNTYLQRMQRVGDCINIVSPDYYECGTNGTIIYTKLPDPLLIAAMRDRKISVTPFLSNHWNRENARKMLANRAACASWIAASVAQYGLDGLDIDIQNINENDRADFTDFIRLLRGALPQSASLTVCVAPNPYNTNVGWQGGYDYAALSEYCDHIFMMTYDESYEGGEPGAVSSYNFIRKSIEYGLKYVAPEKLMLGIPFYGRYWSSNGTKGAAWTLNDIEYLVETTNAVTWYDETKECARATIVVGADDNVTTWGGRKVAAGTYDVWYDDARSYEKKLALVRHYGIRGAGSWALGQEPAWMWDNYAAWLNGLPFNDIEAHWAQSYIIGLYGQGIIYGKSAKTFEPQSTLTRAEAASLLLRLAGVSEGNGGAAAFNDTQNHWANAAIASAKSVGLVNGMSATVFEPDRAVTREEFAVMAERYTNIEDTLNLHDSVYTDVSETTNAWSNAAIVKLSVNNVLNGYGDGTFRPRADITRAEAAKVVTMLGGLPTRFVNGEVLPEIENGAGPR